MAFSPLQENIFADIENGDGNTVVVARAGCGKTTTIMAALSRVPIGLSIALFAFNNSIKTELAAKAPKGVEVRTLHSHGFAAIRKTFRFVNTIPNLIQRLDAKVLPLSITYRCGKEIVKLAQTEVPDFTAHESAPDGSVSAGYDANKLLSEASSGDMVISRTNAPLTSLCLNLLKMGKRAAIKGRDVAEGLIALIKRSKKKTIEDLESWLTAWHEKESSPTPNGTSQLRIWMISAIAFSRFPKDSIRSLNWRKESKNFSSMATGKRTGGLRSERRTS